MSFSSHRFELVSWWDTDKLAHYIVAKTHHLTLNTIQISQSLLYAFITCINNHHQAKELLFSVIMQCVTVWVAKLRFCSVIFWRLMSQFMKYNFLWCSSPHFCHVCRWSSLPDCPSSSSSLPAFLPPRPQRACTSGSFRSLSVLPGKHQVSPVMSHRRKITPRKGIRSTLL